MASASPDMKSNFRPGLFLLAFGAVLAPLRAATLDEGFGPLSLVEGAPPVKGGCGRPVGACTCGHKLATDAGTKMNMAEMDMDAGAEVVIDPNARLGGGGDLNASPNSLVVINVGASAYSINSINNPILTFVRGQTYTFSITANGHPFYIKTVQSTGTGNAYTSGVTGGGTQTGTVTFTVPLDAPDTLFYDCSLHTAMTNRIDVVPEPAVPAAVAVAVLGLFAAGSRRHARA